MRAKFRVHAVTFRGDHTNPNTPREYVLGAVYDTTTPENKRFTLATPWAEMKMTVNNPAAQLEVGKDYYLDFTPVHDVIEVDTKPAVMGNTHDVTGVYTPGHAATENDPARALADADNAAPDTTTTQASQDQQDQQASQGVTRTTPSGEPVDTIDPSGSKVDTDQV